jgi:Flp pilus assembly protein TadD
MMRVSATCFLLVLLCMDAAAAPKKGAPNFRINPTDRLDEPGTPKASEEAQKLSKRALAAFQKGDLATAENDFQKVLKLAPKNAATLVNLGLIAYRQKSFVAAEEHLQKAIEAQPQAGLGWLLLGVVRYDQDKLDGALAALAQAVYLEPKDARAHHYLGVTIGRKGWYSGAEEQMRTAIELEPDYPEAHYNLAVFYLQRVPPALELARRHYYKSVDLGAEADPEMEKKLSAGE